jgi:hypothetical protein
MARTGYNYPVLERFNMPIKTPEPLLRNGAAVKATRRERKDEVQKKRIERMERLLACCDGNKSELTRLLRSGIKDYNAAGNTGSLLKGASPISLLVANWVESLLRIDADGVDLRKVLFTPEGGLVYGGSVLSFYQLEMSAELIESLIESGIEGVFHLMEHTREELNDSLKITSQYLGEIIEKLEPLGGLRK